MGYDHMTRGKAADSAAQSTLSRPAEPWRAFQTPFADALLRVTSTGMASLHALPLSAGYSVAGSALRGKYAALFGDVYLTADVSLSGSMLDSFFRPKSCLALAQRLAACAFGADATLFITGGTTLANRIAVDALKEMPARAADRPVRVLADRTCHQSIHFSLDQAGAEVSYCAQKYCCDKHGRTWPDIQDFIDRYRQAAETGQPFDFVVLSAANYDGATLDMHSVLAELLPYTDTLDVLIDEAWTAINVFHPLLSQHTALASGRWACAAHPGKRLRMIVTQSAHKSMSSLRQGSYLHVIGDAELVAAASGALYRNHTTSPSLPVLASLDLARAHAQTEGAQLVERSIGHARELRHSAAEDPGLAAFSVAPPPGDGDPWIVPDPTKLLLEVNTGLLTASELRVRLTRDYGLYVARATRTGILLNLHIGVTPEVFGRLMMALRDISGSVSAAAAAPDHRRDGYLVAYPPGIPLKVPGQPPGGEDEYRIAAVLEAGAELFTV